MKALLRVPTGTTYGFLELKVDMSPREIVEKYNEFLELVKPLEGLDVHEWVKLRDGYFVAHSMNPELQELSHRCSTDQRHVINQIKLAIKNTKEK